ncbi:hypothetical protein CR513_42019, partial [Mucuna pruriens]
MKCMFLDKFFPTSRTTTIKNEIYGIRQYSGETLLNTGKDSTSYVPHVRIIKSYFYECLMMMDQSMIDVASGGALMDKTPTITRNLLSNVASNTQ